MMVAMPVGIILASGVIADSAGDCRPVYEAAGAEIGEMLRVYRNCVTASRAAMTVQENSAN
jgi:hypothetical protein